MALHIEAQAFKPEHAGQLNFYLSAVDAQIKAPEDKPTIGLLLCRTQNRLVAEYSLSGIDKPIGVAIYAGDGDAPVAQATIPVPDGRFLEIPLELPAGTPRALRVEATGAYRAFHWFVLQPE